MEVEVTIVAKIFILNDDGLILTIRRAAQDTHPGRWDLPGGGVDFGENPNSAVIREAKEEVGLIIESPIIFFVGSKNEEKYVVELLYYAQYDGSEIKLSEEHDQIAWVTKDEFLELDVPRYFLAGAKQLPR